MDRLETMRVFVTVASLGSFADAARQLRLSPSVITRSVADLEDRLTERGEYGVRRFSTKAPRRLRTTNPSSSNGM